MPISLNLKFKMIIAQCLKKNELWDGMCEWPVVFGVALWRIWFWLNKYFFEGTLNNVHYMVMDITTRAEEISRINEMLTPIRA